VGPVEHGRAGEQDQVPGDPGGRALLARGGQQAGVRTEVTGQLAVAQSVRPAEIAVSGGGVPAREGRPPVIHRGFPGAGQDGGAVGVRAGH